MSPRSSDRSTFSAVVSGVLVGVLVFALGLGTLYAVRHTDWNGSGDGSSATPSPSGKPRLQPLPAGPMPATDPKLKKFYDQRLSWQDCGANECSTLTVPLDYAHPDGQTIGIHVLRVPARGKRIGSLLVNPGGPGASGAEYAAAGSLVFGADIPRSYDLIGFDPRGVGSSDPLKCVGTKELDELVAADPDPDDQAERDELDAQVKRFGDGCLKNGGALARHMSTPEAARDMDILRDALGEKKMDYFGASYGTFLGATYANLFPTHVGRMVLDGAVDPALSNEQLSLQQAAGFETALRAYIADCVQQGNCILGDSVDAGAKRVRQFLDDVETTPLKGDGSRQLTSGTAMLGIWMPLYVKQYWPQLTSALTSAIKDHDGSQLLGLADLYNSRGPNGYTDNSINALYAVNCLDHDDYVPTSQVPRHFAAFEKASPTFGRAFAFGLSTCSAWPVKSHRHTVAMAAKGAAPIVVLGTTRDPATPYAWAKNLARELSSGVFVSRDGDGHTAFNQGNSCIDRIVVDYLVDGKVPKDGTSC